MINILNTMRYGALKILGAIDTTTHAGVLIYEDGDARQFDIFQNYDGSYYVAEVQGVTL